MMKEGLCADAIESKDENNKALVEVAVRFKKFLRSNCSWFSYWCLFET